MLELIRFPFDKRRVRFLKKKNFILRGTRVISRLYEAITFLAKETQYIRIY